MQSHWFGHKIGKVVSIESTSKNPITDLSLNQSVSSLSEGLGLVFVAAVLRDGSMMQIDTPSPRQVLTISAPTLCCVLCFTATLLSIHQSAHSSHTHTHDNLQKENVVLNWFLSPIADARTD